MRSAACRESVADACAAVVHEASRRQGSSGPGYREPAPYRVELFGPRPVLAGFVTTYHVLFAGEQVYAELMAVGWMTPLVDPAIRVFAMLDALTPDGADPCQNIPFTTYAAAGWPLVAGKIDHPTIETTKIAFDYKPRADELTPPASFQEGDLQDLRGRQSRRPLSASAGSA